MSHQRMITSFFSTGNSAKKEVQDKNTVVPAPKSSQEVDSPIKSGSKKRNRLISSSDESESEPAKPQEPEVNKKTVKTNGSSANAKKSKKKENGIERSETKKPKAQKKKAKKSEDNSDEGSPKSGEEVTKKTRKRAKKQDSEEKLPKSAKKSAKKEKSDSSQDIEKSPKSENAEESENVETKKPKQKRKAKKLEDESQKSGEVVTKKTRKKVKKQDEEKLPKSGKKSAKKEKSVSSQDEEKSPKSEHGNESGASEQEDSDKSPKKEKVEEIKSPQKAATPTKKGGGLGNWLIRPEKPESSDGGTKSEKVAELEYDPSIAKYDEVKSACWKSGEKVPYIALARTLDVIEKTSARLKMIEYLSNFFRSVIVLTPDDLLPCVYLCLNKQGPAYEGLELGVGETLLMKTIASATGRSLEKIKADLANKGDLGSVAESCRASQRTMFAPAKLTVGAVFKGLKEIAQMSGNSVMQKKIGKMTSLLVAGRGPEARFVMRSLEGKLRVGLAEQSVLMALAQAVVLALDKSDKSKQYIDSQAVLLKTAYCECPNYDLIVPVLLQDGIAGLKEKCKLTPAIPLKPMLAYPSKGVQEVLERFENARFTCEYKYDGERAQIHVLESKDMYVYSRNQENTTGKYPDIIKRMHKALKEDVNSCILDTEAVAWDRETKKIRPFQVLSTRKKKDVEESEIKVQVCVFAFDLLYLNGRSLVKEKFEDRRELLKKHFQEVEGEFMFVRSIDSSNVEEIGEFLEESVKGDCEGLMVKALDVDATYEIAKRSHNWLKLKKDYLEGVGDTLDLVVIGGYHGKGKRSGLYGGFLLACYDDENEEYQTICKIGTGFKDEDFEKHCEFLKQHVIDKPRSYYSYEIEPDVWFEPVQVWEVKCADLTKSPVHKAAVGLIDPANGISLRFPRFLRIRDDKTPEMATNARQVVELYQNQEQVKNQNKKKKVSNDDEEFY